MEIPVEVLNSLHSEVRADVETFLTTGHLDKDIFYEKPYHRALYFNQLIKYNISNEKVILYSGGLGHGSFVDVVFDFTSKQYYIVFSDVSSETDKYILNDRWCLSKEWNDIVIYLDNFFLKY